MLCSVERRTVFDAPSCTGPPPLATTLCTVFNPFELLTAGQAPPRRGLLAEDAGLDLVKVLRDVKSAQAGNHTQVKLLPEKAQLELVRR